MRSGTRPAATPPRGRPTRRRRWRRWRPPRSSAGWWRCARRRRAHRNGPPPSAPPRRPRAATPTSVRTNTARPPRSRDEVGGLGGVVARSGHDDRGPRRRARHADGAADPGPAPGDEDDASVELLRHRAAHGVIHTPPSTATRGTGHRPPGRGEERRAPRGPRRRRMSGWPRAGAGCPGRSGRRRPLSVAPVPCEQRGGYGHTVDGDAMAAPGPRRRFGQGSLAFGHRRPRHESGRADERPTSAPAPPSSRPGARR